MSNILHIINALRGARSALRESIDDVRVSASKGCRISFHQKTLETEYSISLPRFFSFSFFVCPLTFTTALRGSLLMMV